MYDVIGLTIEIPARREYTGAPAPDLDVMLKLESGVDIAAMRASNVWNLRLASLFLDIAVLAREDERLAEILHDRYRVRVTHGDAVLWPPSERAP